MKKPLKLMRMFGWTLLILTGLCMLVFGGSGPARSSGSRTVAVIPIKGTIHAGMKNFVAYSLEEARQIDAVAVILELDTHGGYIEEAEDIQKLLEDSDLLVYAYVRPRAISAGAYLALAADAIYMAPAGKFGAAEPRIMGGGQADEKILSYWESEMKSVAERRDRDTRIAAAMVRKDMALEGVVERGVLLTLTAAEALAVGYSEGTVSSRSELLALVDLPGAELVEFTPRLSDRMVGWVTNPIVATLLLVLGIGGLVLEVLTAGFGVAGIFSLLAFALYFGGHISAGMAEYWVVFLFLFGVVMMLVEAFMPGFGIFGVAGLAATVTSIVLAASDVETGLLMLLIAMVLAGVFSVLAFRFFAKRGALRHIILSEEERAELGYVAPADRKGLLGLEGVAVTTLRPAGSVEIDGKRVDVVSEGGFIPAGAAVKVVFVEGMRVVVREAASTDGGDSENEDAQ